jgi:hypothetical protein
MSLFKVSDRTPMMAFSGTGCFDTAKYTCE